MSYLDPTTWRAFTKDEMSAYLAELGLKKGAKKRGSRKGGNRPVLVLQKTISPFDAYTYLHARFGAPNGLQTSWRETIPTISSTGIIISRLATRSCSSSVRPKRCMSGSKADSPMPIA